MSQPARDSDDLVQVAWLDRVGQLSQQGVSQHLGISRFKVLRFPAEARDQGLARVSIEHDTTGTLALAGRLAARCGLTGERVARIASPDEAAARRAVGILAAGFPARIGRDGAVRIGVGWGRTMAAIAQALTGLRNPDLCFVSLMGSMARMAETGPFYVCARRAAFTGGSAMVLPASILTDSEKDCRTVLRQRPVRKTLHVARVAPWSIISLGGLPARCASVHRRHPDGGRVGRVDRGRSGGRQHGEVLYRRWQPCRHRSEPPRALDWDQGLAGDGCDAAGRRRQQGAGHTGPAAVGDREPVDRGRRGGEGASEPWGRMR
jgi:DNA-binding transcriptional regulator LsrR (DeoR family)